MPEQYRRRVLTNASVGAVVPNAPAAQGASAHDGPFLAWVTDARSGAIAVIAGPAPATERAPRV